jgi:hypothetical protein
VPLLAGQLLAHHEERRELRAEVDLRHHDLPAAAAVERERRLVVDLGREDCGR